MIRGLAVLLLSLTGPLGYASTQTHVQDSLFEKATAITNDTARVLALREVAYAYAQSDPNKAIEIAHQMQEISEIAAFATGIAMAYDIEANCLRIQGKYNEALEKHLKALRIFDQTGDIKRYRSVLVNTGSDYSYMQNYRKALLYYNKALTLTDDTEKSRYVTILNNMGNTYSMLGDHAGAIKVYQKALPIAQADSTYDMQSTLYSSLGIAYAQNGNLHAGAEWLIKAIHAQQVTGDLYHYASSTSTLAGIYVELKQYRLAEIYLDKALKAAQTTGAKSVIANYYRNKAHLCFKTGRAQEAYQWLDKYVLLNDSLINENHIAQLAETEVKYNTEVKNRELSLLTAERALQQSEIQKQRFQKYMIAALVLALISVLAFMYRSVQMKKRANRDLENENSLLQKENMIAQYETLRSQVNPHFLFNSLNALSSLIRSDTAKAIEFTTVFSRLYRQVLELKGDSVITLSEELRLVDDYIYLQKIRFGNNLVFSRQIEAEAMKHVIPPFCLQMLVENAIKHNIISDASPLHVKVSTKDGFLLVENNIQQKAQAESTGTGIRNIRERFRLIHDELPVFEIIDGKYLAKIPLIKI